MPASHHRRALAFGSLCLLLAACKGDSTAPNLNGVDPISNPTGLLNVGDLLTINVNGNDACENPVYHAARVVAVGSHSIIFADTLNPKNGFATSDYQRFAARFDSLVYPLDVANFGEPTDIDKNGRISIVFSRAVNELTPFHATSYVGGFAYSRDLFPAGAANARAQACKGSNQGEYFYALAADPSGLVNGNARSVAFVDSVTTSVLAHELQHIINASRRLYVVNSPAFEEKWLDEALAHIAEELLFYRESGLAPRNNLDINAIRASTPIRLAYNSDMSGNTGRYKTFLTSPNNNSPYAPGDSLPTRGAAWSLLRYSLDRALATDGFVAGNGQVITGSGSVSLAPGTTSGEYMAVIVNTSSQSGSSANYSIAATGINGLAIPAGSFASVIPVAGESGAPQPDVAFESRLRSSERATLTPLMSAARTWYAASNSALAPSQSQSASFSNFADGDASILLKLVSSQTTGLTNFASAFGDAATFVRDWSVSNAVDDVTSLNTQYQQRSWNYHSIYPGLTNPVSSYPLAVSTLLSAVTVSGTVASGGSAYYRIPVAANATASVTLAGIGTPSPSVQMIVIKTK